MKSIEGTSKYPLQEARYKYATAVLLYYAAGYESPTPELYESATRLLDRTLKLIPDFSDASDLREEIWHRFLRLSKGTDEQNEQYNAYIKSDAWAKKREERMETDGYTCACGNPAEEVHLDILPKLKHGDS